MNEWMEWMNEWVNKHTYISDLLILTMYKAEWTNIKWTLTHSREIKGISRRNGYWSGMCVSVKSFHSCLTLYDTMDHRPPGSSVHGILQARIQVWIATSSSMLIQKCCRKSRKYHSQQKGWLWDIKMSFPCIEGYINPWVSTLLAY